MIRGVKRTVLEVETVLVLIGAVGYVTAGLIWGFASPEALGIVVGVLGAMALFYSMSQSVETSVDMGDPTAARRHSSKMQAIRYAVIILAAMALSKWDRVSVTAALISLLFLKPALYLQPVTHKLFCRWFHWKDELSPDALILPDDEDEDDEDAPDGLERWLERKYKK